MNTVSMNIVYRSGQLHGNADSLSRRSYKSTDDKDMSNKTCAIADKVGEKLQDQVFPQEICLEQIRTEQNRDPDIKLLIDYLVRDELPDDSKKRHAILVKQEQFLIHKDTLYHIDQRKPKVETGVQYFLKKLEK